MQRIFQRIKLHVVNAIYGAILLCFPKKQNIKSSDRANDSVIVVFCAALGDFVLFCDIAKKLYIEGKKITLVCQSNCGVDEFAKCTNYFYDIISLKNNFLMRIRNIIFLRKLRADIALTAPASRHILTDIYTLSTGAKVKIAAQTHLGSSSNKLLHMANSRFDQTVLVDAVNELKRYEQYLSRAGIYNGHFGVFQLIMPSEKFTEKVIAIFPGAAGSPAKCWPIDRFTKVVQSAHQKFQLKVIILGTKQERHLANTFMEAVGNPLWVKNFCGETSIKQTLDILSKCCAVLANDSGGAHLGIAVNTPTIIIAGQWEFERFYPNPSLSKRHKVVYDTQHELGCKNCGKSRPNCAIAKAAQCILNISVDSVLRCLTEVVLAN